VNFYHHLISIAVLILKCFKYFVLSTQIIGDAVSSFILEVVVKHGEPAARLCNKDPFTLKYGVYLLKLFPHAKFIFMVRDGRAVVHSLITRKVRDCKTLALK